MLQIWRLVGIPILNFRKKKTIFICTIDLFLHFFISTMIYFYSSTFFFLLKWFICMIPNFLWNKFPNHHNANGNSCRGCVHDKGCIFLGNRDLFYPPGIQWLNRILFLWSKFLELDPYHWTSALCILEHSLPKENQNFLVLKLTISNENKKFKF